MAKLNCQQQISHINIIYLIYIHIKPLANDQKKVSLKKEKQDKMYVNS